MKSGKLQVFLFSSFPQEVLLPPLQHKMKPDKKPHSAYNVWVAQLSSSPSRFLVLCGFMWQRRSSWVNVRIWRGGAGERASRRSSLAEGDNWCRVFRCSDGHLVCIIHSPSLSFTYSLFPAPPPHLDGALGAGLIYYRWVIVY